jgi:hypothetical protein
MGMSTYLIGFAPPDEKWHQMKDVYDACMKAKVPIPRDVEKFFNDEPPDDSGVQIEEKTLRAAGAVRDFSDDSRTGIEVRVDKLPPQVQIVRFVNSW